ncbi:hypothetical protein Pmani_024279 [Petrolisthes manimaculis]|uniref:ZZ-type zinc finger-containing protein 3 n=1 Tax=Petrolisthes manimaculis TaxID=1843537 RepID=A0AAE1PAE8_9EUCA|nr:hypothetical protein Pmani_024279 [Petrolisthes manimaculis]
MLLRTLIRLQVQRAKAVQDIERLQEVRDVALQEPLAFVTALQNGENLNLPSPQNIVQIPHVDWEKYNITSLTQTFRPNTRKRIMSQTLNAQQITQEGEKALAQPDDKMLVRGRVYNGTKPQTFNQSWSDEEQRKLEELLIKFPDEQIASHRWFKISKELGTRTPLQVQSRVQKYFLALRRDGLPVPGKNPKESLLKRWTGKKRLTHRHAIVSKSLSPSSNFMKAFQLYDDSEDKTHGNSGCYESAHNYYTQPASPCVSDEEDITSALRETEEYKQLLKIKQVKALKLQEMESGVVLHYGFSCDGCGVDPICGTRWHCVDCPPSTSTDLCGMCVKYTSTSTTHNSILPSTHDSSTSSTTMNSTSPLTHDSSTLPSASSTHNSTFSTHNSTHRLLPLKALCIKDSLAS